MSPGKSPAVWPHFPHCRGWGGDELSVGEDVCRPLRSVGVILERGTAWALGIFWGVEFEMVSVSANRSMPTANRAVGVMQRG